MNTTLSFEENLELLTIVNDGQDRLEAGIEDYFERLDVLEKVIDALDKLDGGNTDIDAPTPDPTPEEVVSPDPEPTPEVVPTPEPEPQPDPIPEPEATPAPSKKSTMPVYDKMIAREFMGLDFIPFAGKLRKIGREFAASTMPPSQYDAAIDKLREVVLEYATLHQDKIAIKDADS